MKHTNQHWEVIANGISVEIVTAKDLWEAALLYFQWCDNNPVYKPELIKSGENAGSIGYTPIPRAYSISGLCMHLGITGDWLMSVAKQEEKNDFFFVANRLLEICFTQNKEYAMAGVFNAVLSSKVLGLNNDTPSDKPNQIINITVEPGPRLIEDERDVDLPEDKQ